VQLANLTASGTVKGNRFEGNDTTTDAIRFSNGETRVYQNNAIVAQFQDSGLVVTNLTASGTVTASGLLSAGAGKIQITNSGLGMVSSSAGNPSWYLGVQGSSVLELSRPTSTSVQLRNHRDGDILLTSAGGSVTIGAGGNLTASGTVTAGDLVLGPTGKIYSLASQVMAVQSGGITFNPANLYQNFSVKDDNGNYALHLTGGGSNIGNFGIGVGNSPSEKLDVGGNIKASGTVTAAGATFNGLVSQTGLGGSTYFGEGAGIADDLSANNNTGVGYQSLKSTTTGYGNVGIGATALFSNTSGVGNIGIGWISLFANTTGGSNIAIGTQALRLNTTGSGNVASGHQSLYSNLTGLNNVANGSGSLFYNTSGSGNVAIGQGSLYANTTGGYKVAIGVQAGRYIADGSTVNETSSNSLYLGANTKALASGDTNEIVIGYDAIGAGSNTATLGNESITKTVLRGDVETDGTVKTGSYTVGTLPLTPSTGMRAQVTDSSVDAHGHFGATVAAAGLGTEHKVPVFYNGTNWIIA
jgi:hypothetical protein